MRRPYRCRQLAGQLQIKQLRLSMQQFIALYLLTLAAVALGLLLASLPYLGDRIEGRPHPLWALSLALFVTSLACFSWLTARVTLIGVPQYQITTFANVTLFTAALLQAAFFRSLNAPERAMPFKAIGMATLAFAVMFEWARQNLDFDSRVLLIAGATTATLIWQITEIRRLRSHEPTYQVSFLLWTTAGELVCALMRFALALSDESRIMYFAEIPVTIVVATLLNALFNLLSYVGINKYWAEKTSLDRTSAVFESAQVKALSSEKDRLILRLMAANKTAASGALSASLTHELAQPLTAMGLNLTSLKHSFVHSAATGEQQRLIDSCVENTHRLHSVLRTLRGMFIANDVAEEEFTVSSVMQSVASLTANEAHRHGIDVQIACDGELTIRGRPSELQHALLNLTLNAIEALASLPHKDKVVSIVATGYADGVNITVSDNGPGVSPAMSERIFEMLDSDKPGGMGLGLWLCRHIAERHGGSIAHRSNAPSGAIFEIALPKRPTSSTPAAASVMSPLNATLVFADSAGSADRPR